MTCAAITGTTTGLGAALVNEFLRNMDVDTFSRSNGYNIREQFPIVEHCRKKKIDTFINNAYAGQAQSQLLMKLAFACPDMHIINIGSVSRNRTDANTIERIEYATDKAHLYETHSHLQRLGKRTTYIDLGMVDTAYNKRKPGTKLDPKAVAKIILDIAIAGYNKTALSYYSITPHDTDQLELTSFHPETRSLDGGASRNNDGSGFPTTFPSDPFWTSNSLGYPR